METDLDTTENDVVVKAKTKRILAFDLMRGFFLLVIIVDHVELYPNGWDFLTGKGRLWVSAAEGFFFLSGLLIGMIYKRRLHLGMKYIFQKMWTRALELYVVGTALTFVFLLWVELTNHAPIKDTLPDPIPWSHILGQAFLTRFTYGWADFLVHFAVLMLFAPIVFYLVARGKWWLALIGMTVAWYIRGESFVMAWQFIFNIGIIIGYYWYKISGRYRSLDKKQRSRVKLAVGALAAISFAASYLSIYLLTLLNQLYGSLTPWLRHVTFTWNNYNADTWVFADKWTMGWLRILLFFCWFCVLYWFFRTYEARINRFTKGILEMLGRNSLFVYTLHAFIVFTLKMYFIPRVTSVLQNFLITTAGMVVLISITTVYTRWRERLLTRRLSSKNR